MANEKFIIATNENQFQINVRNILNTSGYFFLDNCLESTSLMRMIRSYEPDFVVVDGNLLGRDMNQVIETVDDEQLCFIIVVGETDEVINLVSRTNMVYICLYYMEKNILENTIEIAKLSFSRIRVILKKLKEMTDNYETRKLVERAKWILMEQNSISEKEAYDRMRKKSMNTRISMKQIAEAILYTYDIRND